MIFMMTAQLNQAARHRNVYYDTIGGDPYGKRPAALSRLVFDTVLISIPNIFANYNTKKP